MAIGATASKDEAPLGDASQVERAERSDPLSAAVTEKPILCTPCDACQFCDDVCEDLACDSCSAKRSNERHPCYNSQLRCPSGCRCASTHYYTLCQVRRHNHTGSCWLVAGDVIYNATPYLNWHPGGPSSLVRKSGGVKDCMVDLQFHSKKGKKAWKGLIVGKLRACPGEKGGLTMTRDSHWWMFWAR